MNSISASLIPNLLPTNALPALTGTMASLVATDSIQSLAADTAKRAEGLNENLESVAGQFEGLFMSMLLKEMRATLGEEGLFGSDNGDAYGAMFDMFLGQHLANQNSLGIAQALNRYMQNANAMDGSPETAQ